MNVRSPHTWSTATFALAVVLLAGVAISIAGSRYDLVSYPNAFAWLRYIAIAGAVVGVLALISWIMAVQRRSRGAWLAALTTVLMTVMVALFYLYQAGPPEPLINDITTDTDDPPEFIAVLPLRPAGSNSAEYGGAEIAAKQRAAYPDIKPVFSTLKPDAAFDRALEVATDLGWNVVASDRNAGRIEAVDTTPFFRFRDDIVVRVRPDAKGSRIDIRSHSRLGLTDLGKNAARIRTFIRAYPVQG